MVVPVLITSIQSSEYPVAGPNPAHTSTLAVANPKARPLPTHADIRLEQIEKNASHIERSPASHGKQLFRAMTGSRAAAEDDSRRHPHGIIGG
jgi:hypothetical protein